MYSLTFVQLKYPQVWKSSNQFYDAWRVRHFVTYFLQHVLSVGKCLLYVKFYSKEGSNKFSEDQILKWFIIILKPPPFYHPIVMLLKLEELINLQIRYVFIYQTSHPLWQSISYILVEMKKISTKYFQWFSMWPYTTSSSALGTMRTGRSRLQEYI